jgi:hypothetical protein
MFLMKTSLGLSPLPCQKMRPVRPWEAHSTGHEAQQTCIHEAPKPPASLSVPCLCHPALIFLQLDFKLPAAKGISDKSQFLSSLYNSEVAVPSLCHTLAAAGCVCWGGCPQAHGFRSSNLSWSEPSSAVPGPYTLTLPLSHLGVGFLVRKLS